ncbi:MAG: sulfurtransferase-like selenium metabolism protein YedF [Syntrophomonadaceae bacterium]|nr:sulfurtransferase-like selenium metabolism protein YedF [Syntrophomonadaceae bacterium]
MKQVVDARGLNCPEPLILTKKALDMEQVSEVLAIVDNRAALENINRLIKTMKLASTVEEKFGEYYIDIAKESGMITKTERQKQLGDTVILISSNLLGRGDDQLGGGLMKAFLYTLTQFEGEIGTVIFMNSAVLLSTEGSEMLEHLHTLEESGVELLSCGTCLNFYQLENKLQVGSVSNMYTIIEKMLGAGRLITL